MPDPKLKALTDDELATELSDRQTLCQNAEVAVAIAVDERNAVVLELRRRKVRNSQIATMLGISPARVGQIIARAEEREREVAA